MHISTETSSSGQTLGDAKMRFRFERARDCDFCGRPVRHETASERIHRGDQGVDVVVVCRECEVGAD